MSARKTVRATQQRPGAIIAAPAQKPHPSARTWWLLSLAIFGCGVLAYANTLGHGFVWDDSIWLEQKIRFYRGPADAFFEPTFMPMRQVYRPLSQLTYWLDQSLWWRNAFGFHLTSVVLHAANGVLVFWLASALAFGVVPAVAAALVFVVHPIQPESVAWITNRVDVLATFFVLVAVLATLRPPSPARLALIAIASFGAAASKETGCVVPFLVLATSLVGARRDSTARPRAPITATLAALAGVIPYFLLRPSEAGTGISFGALGGEAVGKLVGAFGYQVERLFMPMGFWPYLAKIPTGSVTLMLAAVGAFAAAVGLLAPDPSGGRRRFAVLWILVAAALPVLVVLADFSSTPVAEHRLYLATVSVALLLALALESAPPFVTAPMGCVALAIALAALTAVTIRRNALWHDELTLWSAVTERMDSEALPYLNLGLALADAGRPADAEAAYRRALARSPNDVTRQRTSINLGLILADRGDVDEAETLFTSANQVGSHAIAFRGLAMVARRRATTAARAGDRTTAVAELNRAMTAIDRALAINPRYYQGHLTRAAVLYDGGQYRAALTEYQKVVELAADTDAGRQAALNVRELTAWLAAHPEAP